MATVVFEDPIHHISGKISKKFRTTYNYRKQSDRKYTSVRGERTTPVSESEQAWRELFAQISSATRERMKDPTKVQADQVAFKAQSEYKTFYQYVWHLMRAEIEGK